MINDQNTAKHDHRRADAAALIRQVEEELQGDWVAERDFDPQPLLFLDDEEASAPGLPEAYASPNGDGAPFERFRASNVLPQRQAGFSTSRARAECRSLLAPRTRIST